jgi:hypothetical protein
MYLYRPPPVPSIHLIIDMACPLIIGEMSLGDEDKVILELWITIKCFEARQNLVTVKLEMFTPHDQLVLPCS